MDSRGSGTGPGAAGAASTDFLIPAACESGPRLGLCWPGVPGSLWQAGGLDGGKNVLTPAAGCYLILALLRLPLPPLLTYQPAWERMNEWVERVPVSAISSGDKVTPAPCSPESLSGQLLTLGNPRWEMALMHRSPLILVGTEYLFYKMTLQMA